MANTIHITHSTYSVLCLEELEALVLVMKQLKSEGWTNLGLEATHDQDCGNEMILHGNRPETASETEKRLNWENATKAHEYNQYLVLRKKYGP